eukprot:1071204-Karenia_brevis.AAC.1
MELSRKAEKDKIIKLIKDYNANMTKCTDQLLEYGKDLTKGNKGDVLGSFDEPPLRGDQGQS